MQEGDHRPGPNERELARLLSRKSFLTTTAAGTLGLWLAACGESDDGGGAPATGATPTAEAEAMSDVTLRHITYINWIGKGEYKDFKRETGITIKQVAANASGDRLTRIQSDPNAGDLVLADLAFAGRLNGLGLLADLDLSKIPNLESVDAPFRIDLASVEQAKMMPTDFGRSGILYNTKEVTEPLESWADFFALAPSYSGKVSMLDFSDGTLPVALIAAGYSSNTKEESEISAAADLLVGIKPHVRAFITADQAKPMVDGSAVMGQVEDWAASAALAENKDLAWVDPADGIHGYVEGWLALKSSPHIEEVHRFMDFHLQPEVAANFCNTLSVAPIQRETAELIDPALKESPITNPEPAVLERINFKLFVGEEQKLYDDAWATFKAA